MPTFGPKIIDESTTTLSGLPARRIVEESKIANTTIESSSLVEILASKNGKQYTIAYDLSVIQK